MLKKMLIVVSIVVTLGILVFGVDGSTSFITGAKDAIKETVSQNTSTKLDVARINRLLQKEKAKVNAFGDEIEKVDGRIKAEREKVADLQREIEKQKRSLEIARTYLSDKKDFYMIDKRRSYEEVESDAEARVAYIEELQERISLSETLIERMEVTLSSCRGSLALARMGIQQREAEFKELKVREVNAAIQQQANALANALNGLSDALLEPSTLQEAMESYQQKVVAKEGRAITDPTVVSGIQIDYPQENEEVVVVTTTEKIDRLLN